MAERRKQTCTSCAPPAPLCVPCGVQVPLTLHSSAELHPEAGTERAAGPVLQLAASGTHLGQTGTSRI